MILQILCSFIALQHFGFFVLESFFWTKPLGLKVFRQTAEQAEKSKVLAANQGLYNSFLFAGLVWSSFHPVPETAMQLKVFFLSCVFVAGVFGSLTVNHRIFWVQASPAMVALLVLFFI